MEEERRVALNAIREKQEQETESELENLKNIVIDLKQKHNVDPEVSNAFFLQEFPFSLCRKINKSSSNYYTCSLHKYFHLQS